MNKAIFIPDSWGIPKNIGTTELVRQVQEKRSLNRKDHEIALECWLTDLNAKSKQTSDNKWICFFDTVSHSKLIEILSRTINDRRVVSLIHKYSVAV